MQSFYTSKIFNYKIEKHWLFLLLKIVLNHYHLYRISAITARGNEDSMGFQATVQLHAERDIFLSAKNALLSTVHYRATTKSKPQKVSSFFCMDIFFFFFVVFLAVLFSLCTDIGKVLN